MKTRKRFGIFTILFLLFFIVFSNVNGNTWEVAIIAMNSQGGALSTTITVYKLNENSRDLSFCGSGTTNQNRGSYSIGGILRTINGVFDINDSNTESPTLTGVQGGGTLYIAIGNYFCMLTYSGSGGYQDMKIAYDDATHLFAIYDNTTGYSFDGTFQWSNRSIKLRNKMGNDFLSGTIQFNSLYPTTDTAGVSYTRDVKTFPHTTSSSEQTVNNVYRKWRKWDDDYYLPNRNLAADNYDLMAIYARQYGASITTSMGGGEVYVNGTSYSCPTSSSYIYDDLNNSITASNQEYNNYSCTFDHWNSGGSFYSNQNTLYFNLPSASVSLEAVYTLKISNVGEGLTFGTVQDDPILLNWNDNPNATSYQIWRKVKINGVWQSPYQIATVDTGVEAYTDNDYKLNAWHTGTELEYDARAVSSSYTQDPYWATVYGSVNAKMNNGLAEGIMLEKETPSDYFIGSFPNPFNPTTTINYQLPKDGLATIKVYDVLGKEIATLVNEHRSAGYYKVDFDASRLTSGVYIAVIQASSFNKSIKLLLTK